MFGLNGFRLGGALAALVALLAIIAGGVWLVRDHDRLKGVERRALACEAAVKNASILDAGTLALNCPQAISDAATRGQRYLDCDAALSRGDLYATRAACSAAVKVRDATASALAVTAAGLTRQLSDTRGQLTAAIDRAAARQSAISRKDRDAQAALARAPRGADNRIFCDDRCLRDLAD